MFTSYLAPFELPFPEHWSPAIFYDLGCQDFLSGRPDKCPVSHPRAQRAYASGREKGWQIRADEQAFRERYHECFPNS
jgi:hypothetical protein